MPESARCLATKGLLDGVGPGGWRVFGAVRYGKRSRRFSLEWGEVFSVLDLSSKLVSRGLVVTNLQPGARQPEEWFDVVIVGGGAAGFFAAAAALQREPHLRLVILERGGVVLSKVRVSGGGRCNVTHACFDPHELVERYPRGQRELLGPFYQWSPSDTMAWFEERGVRLKTETDGRVFPVSDDSGSIIDCLKKVVQEARGEIWTRCSVDHIEVADDGFGVTLAKNQRLMGRCLLLASGGLREGKLANTVRGLGHTIESLAPALFSFHIADERLAGLAGLSVPSVTISVPGTKWRSQGPLLVTHWGMSGPSVLKLSSWGARWMREVDYRFDVIINWAGGEDPRSLRSQLLSQRQAVARRRVIGTPLFGLPKRIWERFVQAAGIQDDLCWAQLSYAAADALAKGVGECRFPVSGKSMNKEEFVTCGGVRLAEVQFKTMESRRIPGLFFAGEILDIDALTGGYNFQAAWTTGYLAGQSMAERAISLKIPS